MNPLVKFMKEHHLTNEDVMKMLNVSEMTVRIWRSKSPRNITDKDFQLLHYLVRDKHDH